MRASERTWEELMLVTVKPQMKSPQNIAGFFSFSKLFSKLFPAHIASGLVSRMFFGQCPVESVSTISPSLQEVTTFASILYRSGGEISG